jgi:Tfp pilus assembly protein PilN
MKAVNLIPRESRANGGISRRSLSAGHAVLAVLVLAVAFVTIYVLTNNTISDRQSKLASLTSQVSQTQAIATSLQGYVSYQQSAQQRASTVRAIVAARFNWDAALTDLSQVVPTGTSLQSLSGTVVPGASVSGGSGGSGGGGTGSLRTAISVPAFEIRGCTTTQDEVANLMSRLRLINGVTRVTLADSQKAGGVSAGAGGGCSANGPSFDLVVFFTAVTNAGTQGITSTSGGTSVPAAGATIPASGTSATSPARGATAVTTPPATTPQATGQPVGNTANGG